MKVDEAGTSELDFRDQITGGQSLDDRLRELAVDCVRAGFASCMRDVRREVAVRRIPRALDIDRRSHDVGRKNVRRQSRQRGAYELLDLVFQSSEAVRVVKRAESLAAAAELRCGTRPAAGRLHVLRQGASAGRVGIVRIESACRRPPC